MNKKSGMVLLTGLLLTSFAQAATLDVQSSVIDITRTNWERSLELQKFDPALGTLNSVSLALYGNVIGGARLESEDSAPATLTLNLAAQLTLTQPNGGLLAIAPTTGATFAASAYDGVSDFGGTSGVTLRDIAFSASDSTTFTDATLMTPYIGVDTLLLPVRATGNSSATGAGNLFAAFETRVGARANVVYDYTPATVPDVPVAPVPEPGTYALMLLGLGLVGLATRGSKSPNSAIEVSPC
jgi:PEP-CTERM motif